MGCSLYENWFSLTGTESVEYKGNSWHDECFTCFSCKRPIGSQSFITKGSDVYCSPCHDKKFAKQCVSCKKVGRVSAKQGNTVYTPPDPDPFYFHLSPADNLWRSELPGPAVARSVLRVQLLLQAAGRYQFYQPPGPGLLRRLLQELRGQEMQRLPKPHHRS